MTTTSGAAELLPIIPQGDGHAVSGRALHAFLGLGRDYTTWFKKMAEYGFTEGQDYLPFSGEVAREGRGTVNRTDHALSLDMAKELAMIQRTDRGREARRYFIEVEKAYRAGHQQYELPQTHAEALRALAASVEVNEALLEKIEKDAPAVGYVETFVTGNDLMLLRDVAKNLGLTEAMLRADLLERGWIYAQTSSRWSEKAQKKVPQTRYSAYAHKARYFRHVPNHEAPRFRDETMHTLKVTPRGAAALARLYKGSDDFLDGIEVAEEVAV